ncbi:hypothetical protein IWX90DRAFT_188836 [Phyllosticta citrichinensis]|uniref:Uncharacterized protein n=1 Tax=Phyllosticta citrichinensis TaxID=1130410 RepID=A0ABR1XWN7_9PEZI
MLGRTYVLHTNSDPGWPATSDETQVQRSRTRADGSKGRLNARFDRRRKRDQRAECTACAGDAQPVLSWSVVHSPLLSGCRWRPGPLLFLLRLRRPTEFEPSRCIDECWDGGGWRIGGLAFLSSAGAGMAEVLALAAPASFLPRRLVVVLSMLVGIRSFQTNLKRLHCIMEEDAQNCVIVCPVVVLYRPAWIPNDVEVEKEKRASIERIQSIRKSSDDCTGIQTPILLAACSSEVVLQYDERVAPLPAGTGTISLIRPAQLNSKSRCLNQGV